MTDDLKMHGWGLNTEYFTTILHMLRSAPDSPSASVDQLCSRVYAPKADLLETLAASTDFALLGASTFQRLRDVDGNPLE